MRFWSVLSILSFSLATLGSVSAQNSTCDFTCMTNMVTEILASMVAKNPYTLPLAQVYRATENSHPAALSMMTSWRTIDVAGAPSILAIDTTNGSAYFALDISEGNLNHKTIIRGRVAVVNQQITELELYITRNRSDHGFSFSAAELPANAKVLINLPYNRKMASREELMALSVGVFTPAVTDFKVSSSCYFTELGWKVIHRGIDGNNTGKDQVPCGWPSAHPYDPVARAGLVIDEVAGIVVQSAMIPGKVFAYQNVSAFIPNAFPPAQEAQIEWFNQIEAEGALPLLYAFGATGDTMEVVQYYDDAIQAMQINLYLSGPNATSTWLS